jgi:hypothetical protein
MIAISGSPAPTPDLIKPELIIRQSTQRNSQPALRRSE